MLVPGRRRLTVPGARPWARSEAAPKFKNGSKWGNDGYYGVFCPEGGNVTYKGKVYKPRCPPHTPPQPKYTDKLTHV